MTAADVVIIKGVPQRVRKVRHNARPYGPPVVEVEANPTCAACLRLVQPTAAQMAMCETCLDEKP